MDEQERREACIDFIKDYTNLQFESEEDMPGTAKLALERMVENDQPSGVATESIGDVSRSYISYQGLDPVIKDLLNRIRKMKW